MKSKKIRLLVVDDSVVYRRIIQLALRDAPDLEIAGVAHDGRVAVRKVPVLDPDILLLDIAMPGMDGLEVIKHVRARYPKLPIIVLSSMTVPGAKASVQALSQGFVDFALKPHGSGSVSEGLQSLRDQLVPKIRALCGVETAGPASVVDPREVLPGGAFRLPVRPGPGWKPRAVVMASSTGGPNALMEVLPALPSDFPLPVLIVQHMPKELTHQFSERLAAVSRMEVCEVRGGDPLRPGKAFVAPGGRHLVVRGDSEHPVVDLSDEAPRNFCRPSADVLFRSAAEIFAHEILGVVLTGMGQDGLMGAGDIRERGGAVIVQDKASSAVWGMPGKVAEFGIADSVLPLRQIPGAILSLSRGAPLDSVSEGDAQ